MQIQTKITARYAETDQMGVVHHAVYPVWYEVARTELIKQTGITYTELEQMGVMTPLAELQSRYLGAARYEDVLVVEAWVSVLTPARVEFCYTVTREGEPKPLNTGRTLHGWVDASTFRPINLKKHFPDLYARMEALRAPACGTSSVAESKTG